MSWDDVTIPDANASYYTWGMTARKMLMGAVADLVEEGCSWYIIVQQLEALQVEYEERARDG
jgi:hypothetical protein